MESPCCSDDYVTFKVVQPMVGHRVGEFYLVHKFAVSKKKTNVRGKR